MKLIADFLEQIKNRCASKGCQPSDVTQVYRLALLTWFACTQKSQRLCAFALGPGIFAVDSPQKEEAWTFKA
jgi:hypothetical protein